LLTLASVACSSPIADLTVIPESYQRQLDQLHIKPVPALTDLSVGGSIRANILADCITDGTIGDFNILGDITIVVHKVEEVILNENLMEKWVSFF
jgi:hypothetical protein